MTNRDGGFRGQVSVGANVPPSGQCCRCRPAGRYVAEYIPLRGATTTNTPYRPRLCSHDVSKTDMERQAPDTRHQAPYQTPDTCFVCITIRRRHLDPLLSTGVRTLDAFHQKCLRQMLGIRWHDRVRNDEVLQRIGLTSLSHLLSRRRISVFGHVARLDDVTPANEALQLHINV